MWPGGAVRAPRVGGGIRTQEAGAAGQGQEGCGPGAPRPRARHPFCREAPSEVDGGQSRVRPPILGVRGQRARRQRASAGLVPARGLASRTERRLCGPVPQAQGRWGGRGGPAGRSWASGAVAALGRPSSLSPTAALCLVAAARSSRKPSQTGRPVIAPALRVRSVGWGSRESRPGPSQLWPPWGPRSGRLPVTPVPEAALRCKVPAESWDSPD